jgi:hypothetical protein
MSNRKRVEWIAAKTVIAARIRNYLARPRRGRVGAPVDYRDGYESKPGPVADRKSDNKKISFDRAILFELLMIPMQL